MGVATTYNAAASAGEVSAGAGTVPSGAGPPANWHEGMMQRRDWMKGTLLTAGATMRAVAGWPGLARVASVERIGLLLPKSGQIYGRGYKLIYF